MLLTGAAMRYQPVCHLAVCPPLPQPEKMWERARGLDRHLTKDDIRVTNKHTERFSASLFITKPKFKLPGVTTTAGSGKAGTAAAGPAGAPTCWGSLGERLECGPPQGAATPLLSDAQDKGAPSHKCLHISADVSSVGDSPNLEQPKCPPQGGREVIRRRAWATIRQ